MSQQTVVAPNRLGQVLGYLSNAVAYANYIRASSNALVNGKKQGFISALKHMAERDTWSGSETMNVEDIYKLAITSAWFYSGVKLIADRVANDASMFKVKDRIGEELRDIQNHPFEILIQTPNALMTYDFIMVYSVLWYYLKGEAYFFISTPYIGMGEPEEIWPIPANKCRPLPGTLHKSKMTGRLCVNYEYIVDGVAYILPGENVVHIRNPNPFDYWSGLSFATPMLQFLRIDYEQGKFTEEFYGRDNAIPTAIISVPADTDPEMFEVAKAQFAEEFGNKRRSAFIRAGDFTVQTILQSFQQADFVNMRKFNRDSLYQIIGIPEGINSGAGSGDSRLAAETAFIRNTVQPLLDRFGAEFTKDIAPYYSLTIVIKAPSIIPADRAMAIQEYTTYSPDRLINENRKILNLPPIELTGVDSIDVMLLVPIRLIPFMSSMSFGSGSSVPPENVPPESGIGDVTGAPSAENQQQQQLGKSSMVMALPFIVQEIKRWRKVSIKEIKAGRSPANLVFTSDIIPSDMWDEIQKGVPTTDEQSIRSYFDSYIERCSEIYQSASTGR